ncbi:hypothetical protein [Shewanella acanthi]|uniref:hypothetical protein n=1 Tax=Shewanella acanthi TaxID=2864212 RepID=UPI001C65909F|nr:hypothetical protein [Shewanella acanthi]QYJ79392.1 hypothetical protein K0H61_02785 [Shewanella acanthi]
MTKRRVFLDGRGSTKIHVEGLGVYVPATELNEVKQKLITATQRIKDLTQAFELEHSNHVDDVGIDNFATALKLKMAEARAKGRNGWNDTSLCTGAQLATALIEHLNKGNAGTFEDIANFAMMLHQRNESPALLVDAINALNQSLIDEILTVLVGASESAAENEYVYAAQVMSEAAELVEMHMNYLMNESKAGAA